MIRRVTAKDRISFFDYLTKKTEFDNLFIVKDNKLKYFETQAFQKYVFNKCIKENFELYLYDDVEIKGVILVSEDYNNYYVSIKANSFPIVNHLLQVLLWNYNKKLILILPKENKFKYLPKKHKFYYNGKDNDNIFFVRKKRIYKK
ncbi:MAG: hypothetical protein ACTSWG_10490 [Candidatus Helarchaeota archaeon]